MHILIIPSWYKTSEQPMVGTFFEEQARALLKKGHQVGIIFPSFYNFSSSTKPANDFIDDNGIPTFYCAYKCVAPKSFRLNYYLYSKRIYATFLEYVKEYGKPDIIHAHTVFYAGIAARYMSKKSRIPFVLTEHFTPFITGGIHKKADVNIAKQIYKDANENIIVSHGFKELLANKLKIDKSIFTVVPNMVDDLFFQLPKHREIHKEAPVFFTVSFLSERKNHFLMLESFSKFLKEYPKAMFKIGGDGQFKQQIINKIKALKIDDNVVLVGELNRKEVLSELNNADVFLLASKFETFGVVLIEALATGMPIVTTDSVGPRDIVTVKNGIMSASFSVEDYCDAMLKVIENYSNYISEDISKDCNNRFSENVIMEQVEKVYKDSVQ
tara:strand:+ start:12228 stop:13379 length:1152 start_codon:yes stop_codon:yes gene_type:complete